MKELFYFDFYKNEDDEEPTKTLPYIGTEDELIQGVLQDKANKAVTYWKYSYALYSHKTQLTKEFDN